MIDPNELLQAFKAEVNAPQGGHIRPQSNFQRWCNTISNDLYQEGLDQFEKSQEVSDNMTPFMKTVNVPLVSGVGKPYDTFSRPVDYDRFASARIILKSEDDEVGCYCKDKGVLRLDGQVIPYKDDTDKELEALREGEFDCEVNIEKIDHSRWGSVCQHRIKKPTIKKPKVTQYDGGFKVTPRGIGVIILNYFRVPVPCVFNYTIGSDDQIIYNANGSTPLEWPSSMMPEFVRRLKAKYYKFIQHPGMMQDANAEMHNP